MEARFSTVRFLPMVSRAATTSRLSEERPSGDPRGRSARDVLLELDDEGLLLGDDDLYGAANRDGLRRVLRLRLTGRWRIRCSVMSLMHSATGSAADGDEAANAWICGD